MSFGFVEPGERDFDGPFWFFHPLDGSSRSYARLDPLACEALIAYMAPWLDEGTARKLWVLLTEEYGSDVYTVQVAAIFGVLTQPLKRMGVHARFSASREGATMWLGHRDTEPNLTMIWLPKDACFDVLRRMP